IHPEGFRYRFHKDVPIVEMPDWLVKVLQDLSDAHQGKNVAHQGKNVGKDVGKDDSKHIKEGAAAKWRLAYKENCDPEDLFKDETKESFDLKDLFVPEGERHHFLVSIGGWLNDGERSVNEIEELLRRVHDEYCEPGPGHSIRGIAEWVVRQNPCHIEPRN